MERLVGNKKHSDREQDVTFTDGGRDRVFQLSLAM